MKFFWRLLIATLAVIGVIALGRGMFGMEFGRFNYWDYHGVLFLIFIGFFPRLTLLFSSIPSGGLLWWLGWLFAPRILVAVLATVAFGYQNPVLVALAWLVALGGESSEKYVVVRRGRERFKGSRGYDSAKWVDGETKNSK